MKRPANSFIQTSRRDLESFLRKYLNPFCRLAHHHPIMRWLEALPSERTEFIFAATVGWRRMELFRLFKSFLTDLSPRLTQAPHLHTIPWSAKNILKYFEILRTLPIYISQKVIIWIFRNSLLRLRTASCFKWKMLTRKHRQSFINF